MPLDASDLWDAIPEQFGAAAIPRRMESPPNRFWRPKELVSDSLLLFCDPDWAELRRFIAQTADGPYLLSPRIGVIEWSKTEVRKSDQYVVGSRIYIQNGDVPWNERSTRLFSWMSRWITRHYFQAPALRAPIAIGQHLLASIREGTAVAIYPNGESVITPKVATEDSHDSP